MIQFSKMHGLGNDFVVIDAIHQPIDLSVEQIQAMADRHFGIGFDQLLIVRPARGDADFRYQIFNADGSEVNQCGNGARCFARFVHVKGLTNKRTIRVETGAGELLLKLEDDDLVSVDMGPARFDPADIPLQADQAQLLYAVTIDDTEWRFAAVSLGNPHAVLRVDDVVNAPVHDLGAQIENHPMFPERVNVGFAQVINPQHLRLRVYERGAGETLACGSGACAAVVTGIAAGDLISPVTVDLNGGSLIISWPGPEQTVTMRGPATFVFEGTCNL